MFHSLDRRYLYTAYKITVVFDDYGQDKLGHGTCFFVSAPNGKIILFTSRHIVDAGFSDAAKSHWMIKSIKVFGFLPPDFDIAFEGLVADASGPIFPENLNEDVAAIGVKKIAGTAGVLTKVPIIDIPCGMVADADFSNEMLLADSVLFPGYPPWHDQNEGRPIMRRGQISSDPKKDYLGDGMKVSGRILAYEAFSFGGSSGSPVFVPSFGVKLNSENPNSGNFRPTKLIGINGGHLLTKDGKRDHSGISYLFKSAVLLELIESFQN